MGRPRKPDANLPQCVYEKHGAFFLVRGGKWTRLGDTRKLAMETYGRLTATQGAMPDLIWRVYYQKLPRLAPSTAAAYKTAAKKLAVVFAEFAPEQVTMRHVAQLKISMAATPNMANETVSFLRGVFDFAVEHQLVDMNPCVGVKRLPVKKRRRCPTDAELAAVHAHAGARLRVIIELLCLTGQRVGDVLQLRRAALTEAGIRFQQQKTGNPLLIRWSPELRAAVARANALDDVRAMTLLRGRGGSPPSYGVVRREWMAACRAAGVVDLNIHDLRAKSVTTAKLQGLDPRAVAGHTSDAQTATYIRLHDEPVVTGPSFPGIFR